MESLEENNQIIELIKQLQNSIKAQDYSYRATIDKTVISNKIMKILSYDTYYFIESLGVVIKTPTEKRNFIKIQSCNKI